MNSKDFVIPGTKKPEARSQKDVKTFDVRMFSTKNSSQMIIFEFSNFENSPLSDFWLLTSGFFYYDYKNKESESLGQKYCE
jgi:hypothetical protein